MKLPAKTKAKWLKALRSGEYKQGAGTLYDPKTASFCCLGVLQHCTSRGCVEATTIGDFYHAIPSREFYIDIGAVDFYGNDMVLADMNDGNNLRYPKRLGFKQIAKWIEKNVEAI